MPPESTDVAATAPEAPAGAAAPLDLVQALVWLGQAKRLLFKVGFGVAVVASGMALLLDPVYTAKTTLLPPNSQQQGGSAAALAALGSLGGLVGGLGAKTPDELYVVLIRSESVLRGLDQQFGLKERYKIKSNQDLLKAMPNFVRVTSDKKTGLITIEADDKEAQFAADLANAFAGQVTKVLGRLAVNEAQQRRMFFEQQLKDTKESLVKAETEMRKVQERSGLLVLDKQAEALIAGAAQVRALIAEREVQLKVMRTGATEQNPEVLRLNSELRALRAELSRMESSQAGSGSAVDLPVGKIPEAAIEYVRAKRELKLQETLLEAMIRQYEIARLDEAKQGPPLQEVDRATPPDKRSKPSRTLFVLTWVGAALLLTCSAVIGRRYLERLQPDDPRLLKLARLRQAWRLRG